MSTLDDLLDDFGLSETQAAVYRTVLRRGEASAGEVADATDVTQSYVYAVAEALADRDLVTIDEAASPTRIRARPPAEAVDALGDRLDALGREIESLYAAPPSRGDGFSVLESRRTVLERVAETVDGASEELLLVLPTGVVDDLAARIRAAHDRGVFTLVLRTETGERPNPSLDGAADAVRAWDDSPPVYAIADGRTGVMGEPGMLSGRHGDEETIAFADETIADGFVGMALSNYWPMGETVHLAAPAPLPATYECLREGIVDAARRTAAGTDLVATVAATAPDGSERTFEDAPVEAVKQGLVDPATNEFPNENSIVLDTNEGRVAVGCPGGIGAFYEDYAGRSLTLTAAE